MNVNQPGENIVSEQYDNYTDTQKEVFAIEIRKTRNKLISIAIVIFVFDLLALLIGNALSLQTFLGILVIPVIISGLALLAVKEPLVAMIIASVIIVGIWAYTIIVIGGSAVVSGWIGKAIIIYLIIAGFQHAVEATRIKKELKGVV
jgi:hypothetical protein